MLIKIAYSLQLFNNNSIEPYETLVSRYGLEQKQFFKYLQVRSYVNQNNQGKLDNYVLRFIAENRNKNIKLANIYSILQSVTKMETKIKEQWGNELSIDIPDEEWRESLKENFQISQSKHWKEYAWKVSQRYFITPDRCKSNKTEGTSCWRGCGEKKANQTHIFFPCSVIQVYWQNVMRDMKYIFDTTVPTTYDIFLGINAHLKINTRERHIFKLLSLIALKQVTRLWKQTKSPDLQVWHSTIEQTLQMGKNHSNS